MNKQKRLQEMLDSDDELPTTYKELAFTPAYEDDDRFNKVAMYNLSKAISDASLESSCASPSSQASDEIETVAEESKENTILFRKGVLSQRDAYCIKVFGTQYDDETLLWFINFTISKDIQSHFNYLVSCLVVDICDYKGRNNMNKYESKRQHCNSKYSFKYI